MLPRKLLLFYTLFIGLTSIANAGGNAAEKEEIAANETKKFNLLTAEMYAKLFKERRKEHQQIAKKMLGSPYEKNYKLLKLAYKKIFEVIGDSNLTLSTSKYSPSLGFPNEVEQVAALILLIENCCIAGELVLHFPEISYKVLRNIGIKTWKPTLNWCTVYLSYFPHVIDGTTVTMMNLLQQEINEELRGETFVNPFAESETEGGEVKLKTQKRTKLKKGPQLNGRHEL